MKITTYLRIRALAAKLDKVYIVKITDPQSPYYGKEVPVVFTGLVYRSKKNKDIFLFESQIKIIKEVENVQKN